MSTIEPPLSGARIPPPLPVRLSAGLLIAQAAGVVLLAVVIVISGRRNGAAVGQLLAQGAYYLVLAALMVVCGVALARGRRWGRTPTIVLQILLLAVAYWLAVPSGRAAPGAGLALLALVTGGLLLTRPANDWISRFPPMFGPEPDR